MTQDEFNKMFVVAMSTYGKAQENDTDVPIVDGETLVDDESTPMFSLPMVKNDNNVYSYAKVPINDYTSGATPKKGLVSAVAAKVQTSGFMEAITQAEFDEIFT